MESAGLGCCTPLLINTIVIMGHIYIVRLDIYVLYPYGCDCVIISRRLLAADCVNNTVVSRADCIHNLCVSPIGLKMFCKA